MKKVVNKEVGSSGLQLCRTQGIPPLDVLKQAHVEMLSLCNTLEHIADTLPNQCETGICAATAARIVPMIEATHYYEDRILFPWLSRAYPEKSALHESLKRLSAEHLEDECYAGEIREALAKMAHGQKYEAETVGYMLRGFFEGVRRHVACEREYIYELLETGENVSPPPNLLP